jgi:hypothetical protein
MVFSDLKLQKAGFPQRTLSKKPMIRFTITSGKLVLDPNIVLFKDLQDLFNCADGPKFLQVLHPFYRARQPFHWAGC